jgi:hypothetical protein
MVTLKPLTILKAFQLSWFCFLPLSAPLWKIMTSRESSTLEDIDPSIAWLQKMRMTGPNDRSLSPEIAEPGGIYDFGHESDNEADEITPKRSGSGTSGIASMSSSAVIELCRLLKRRKNFRPESEADLDAFAAVSDHNILK